MRSIVERVRSIVTAATRITLAPLLVRCGIFVTTMTAFTLAYPVEVLASRVVGLLVVAAALPAIWPRRVWPTTVALLAVGGWLLSTTGEPIVLWRLVGLAGSLYLTHSLCALAVALPYDAVVAPEVLARWVARAMGVVLASAVLSILLTDLVGQGGGTHLVAAAGGLAAAVGAVAVLARLARQR